MVAVFVAGVAWCTNAGAQPIEPVAASTLARARDAIDRGNPADASALLDPVAHATSAPRAASQAEYMLAELAERAFEYPVALAHYNQCLALDPGSRYAARAHSRIEFLAARSEGGFQPLAALERVRLDPVRATDPRAIEGLLTAARTFPPGMVRTEARLVVAEAYAGRLDRPREAIPVLREIANDGTTPPASRHLVVTLLAHARERTGDFDVALAEQIALGGDPDVIAHLRVMCRRERLHRASLVGLAVVSLAGLVSVVRAVRTHRVRPLVRAWLRVLPLAHLALLTLGGAYLTQTYDEHGTAPFFAFGAGALGVYLAAVAWNLTGSTHALARVGRAVVCAAGVMAVSVWAMYRFDPRMLDGIGL